MRNIYCQKEPSPLAIRRRFNVNDKITIKGAKEHNLKNIDLEIPRDKLVVITGLSGSRKIKFSI